VKKISKKKRKILPLFKKYLRHGYYPYYHEYLENNTFAITLERNIHTTIESDLVSVYPELTGNSVKMIKKLMSLITKLVPFTPNWKKIKQILDVKDNRTIKSYIKYLEDASLIRCLPRTSGKFSDVELIEKIYLNNSNQLYALNIENPEQGTVRETFFLSMLQGNHEIIAPKNGDFMVDKKYIFEVGGKNKVFKQIKDTKNAYLALNDIEVGINNKIPLWLFGFLY